VGWSPTPIAHLGEALGGGGTTTAIDTTGANFLVVTPGGNYSGGAVTDSYGNSWAGLNIATNMFSGQAQIFYARNATVGTGHTFSISGGDLSVAVTAWSGSAASPFDVQNAANNSVQPGSITPTNNNELLITATVDAGTYIETGIDSGFAISDAVAGAPGSSYAIAQAYLVQTSAAAVNPTWTGGGGGGYQGTVIAAFAPASSPPPLPASYGIIGDTGIGAGAFIISG
jgi:hypothetical protein